MVFRRSWLRAGMLSAAFTFLIWGGATATPAHAWQYTIQPGDTFYSLGQRFGLPWTLIQGANQVAPNNLPTGKVLNIPDVSTYTVRSGDSLYLIANRFSSTDWAIKELNGMITNDIYPGQVLKVPTGIDRQSQRASNGVGQSDLDLLARLIEAEASGEPYEGKVAVGAVVLNRIKSGKFPSSISGVIYDPLQFTPVRNGMINRPASALSQKAAQDALAGWDPSKGALFFFNPDKSSDGWMRQRVITTQIGGHLFAM
ncbi:cell wall hydrolase, sleb [Heliomicrobium modesticaldum Ice1]|uniref:Cell wall hydrolase, sleb n=1 Tax=Heliobacterium modesticaldum (strain ATCC 51547 / Ice1) TaxID=498761 RepID=B0TAU7_HELMI|nr:cell wall hydrolase [Heliomicrobium modesticaldum]ABZ85058.1 cell wall hydrolase, sleb [Heliomicrobium modesticaldum Ice1]